MSRRKEVNDLVVHSRDPRDRRIMFTEHLEELRTRLAICVAAVLLASLAGLAGAGHVLAWLKRPAGNLLPRLAFFSPTEALSAYLKVAVAVGLVLALPVVLAQVWAFLRPALSTRERGYGMMLVGWGTVCFVAGVAFVYAICLPIFLRFLLTVGGDTLEPVISVSRYLSFVLTMLMLGGVVFELPVVVLVLVRVGVVTPEWLRRVRGPAILLMTIVVAVATPTTDALSLLVMTLPMVVLYEVAIWLARGVRPPPREPAVPARATTTAPPS